jgi:hypothetical protein
MVQASDLSEVLWDWQSFMLVTGLILLGSLLVAAIAWLFGYKRLSAYISAWSALCLSVVWLYFLGPRIVEVQACRVCGDHRFRRVDLGIEWYVGSETNVAKWYREMGLSEHPHEWEYLSCTEKGWGLTAICGDSFGFFLMPLYEVYDASRRVDSATAKELAQDYERSLRDKSIAKKLRERCRQLLDRQLRDNQEAADVQQGTLGSR